MKLKKYIQSRLIPSRHKKLKVKEEKEHLFFVLLDDEQIGKLTYKNGLWRFEYTDIAKDKEIRHIAGFPDFNKVYESKDLWPFFLTRIPSMARKRIKQKAQREGVGEDDLLELLKLFGTNSFTNPYKLKSN